MDAKYALTGHDPLRAGLVGWCRSVECKQSGGEIKDVPVESSTTLDKNASARAVNRDIQTGIRHVTRRCPKFTASRTNEWSYEHYLRASVPKDTELVSDFVINVKPTRLR